MSIVVHLVDDDPDVLKAISRALWVAGYQVVPSGSAEEFLQAYFDAPGCVVLDLVMPGKNGAELYEELAGRGMSPAVIFISGHPDMRTIVETMSIEDGCVLTKPLDLDDLLNAVNRAVARDAQAREATFRRAAARARLCELTATEFEVFRHAAEGATSRIIAARLELSPTAARTHVQNIKRKVGVRTSAGLQRIAREAELGSIRREKCESE